MNEQVKHEVAEAEAQFQREAANRMKRKLEASGMSKAELGECMMDFHMSLRPLRGQITAEKLAILDSQRQSKHEPKFVWVMMDSGAANHVCDPRKHFMSFFTHNNTEGRKFVTATGEIIENEGFKNVKIQTEEGLKCTITFQCAKVDTPVLSTKMLCQADHEVTYTKDGGWILDLRTNKKTKVVLRGGVYYIKLHIMKPSSEEQAADFHRQGM